jgi:putative GTP pyrophosphokinase
VSPADEKDGLGTEYDNRRRLYELLEAEANFILSKALADTGIKLHSFTSRVKTKESFIEKTSRKVYEDPFSEIEDFVGLRVVALFLSDLPQIFKVIRSEFEVLSEDNRIEHEDEASFGYMSAHFVIRMKSSYVGPRYDDIKGLRAEIQVRTILMDAWANVSHYLDYKSESSIPTDLRRDFFALSGLFYVADKHFQLFYQERAASKRRAEATIGSNEPNLDQELNFDTLQAYLHRRFPDRRHAASNTVSDLVEELVNAGYNTLEQVDKDIDRGVRVFSIYEDDRIEERKLGEQRFADVAAARLSIALANKEYGKTRRQPSRFEKYWRMLEQPEKKEERTTTRRARKE